MLNRRNFLLGSAAGLGAAAASQFPAPAIAQGKPSQLVIMTWGGLWGDSLKAGVDTKFEKETGIKIVQDRGGSPVERIAKLRVGLRDQKVDLVQLHDGLHPLAARQGVVENVRRDSPGFKNLKDVPPLFIHDTWVTQIFSAIGVTYNKRLVKEPPRSFADLWRPEFRGRIVLPDITHSIGPYIIPIGAIALGKPPTDEAAGFEMWSKMVALKPIIAKDTDGIMNAFRNEDAVVGLLYKSQTYTVQGWNTPVEWVYPSEGAISISWGTAVAKNTPHFEWAEKYLDMTLDPETQTHFTKAFNYPGSNRRMVEFLPAELKERVKMGEDELKRLIDLDHGFMSDKRADWTDRWNRVIAGG
jgi:spermidine/putrescine-binding protein